MSSMIVIPRSIITNETPQNPRLESTTLLHFHEIQSS